MSYISYDMYVKEKDLFLGKNVRKPPKSSYPRSMHNNLEILIEEGNKSNRYIVKVFEDGELILPYTVYTPSSHPLNEYQPAKDINEALSSGDFLLQKDGKKYSYHDKTDFHCLIETIRFVKKTNGKFDLFWVVES